MIIDCRGQRCPLPIIILARRIGEVAVGAEIVLEADDPAAASDIPAWCRMRGHTYIGAGRTADAIPSYRVRRQH